MRPDTKRDLVGGLLAAAFGGMLLVWGIPLHVQEDMDLRLPVSTMPKIVAVLFVLVGLVQVIRALRVSRLARVPDEPATVGLAGEPLARVASVFGMMAAAALAMRWLPFLAVMPPLMFGLALFYGGGGLLRPIFVAALAPTAVYVVVRHGFAMLLP